MKKINIQYSEFINYNQQEQYKCFKEIINIVIKQHFNHVEQSIKQDLFSTAFLKLYTVLNHKKIKKNNKLFSFFYTVVLNELRIEVRRIYNIVKNRKENIIFVEYDDYVNY